MADSIDVQLATADIYAAALFQLAEQQGAIAEVRAELDTLATACTSDADFRVFLESPAIGTDRRAAALEKMFRGRISDRTLNTLLVMNRHGRGSLLPALRDAYTVRQEQAAGEVEVIVTSAFALSDADRAQVGTAVRAVSGRTPVFRYRIDADLIGGLIVQIGDIRYDNSVRRHLQLLGGKLRDRGDRGLKSVASTN